jgi:hypothetical protein
VADGVTDGEADGMADGEADGMADGEADGEAVAGFLSLFSISLF